MVTLTPQQYADDWWDKNGLRTFIKGASYEDYMKMAFIAGFADGVEQTKYLYTDESSNTED
jgi:hypothetical protein